MTIRKRLHLFGVLWLLAVFALGACQPIQPRPGSSGDAQFTPSEVLSTRVDELLTSLDQEGSFHGAVLIARNGNVILRKGYGLADRERQIPHTSGTRFRLASITKQFTALAILILQEQDKLRIYDAVCQYLPDCPAGWESMKIHHLLTHTAGLFDLRDFVYTSQPPAPTTPAQLLAEIQKMPLQFTPGARFSYTNGGFMVAGYIVEQVSGQPYADFLQVNVFDPLGMEDTGYASDATALAVGYRNSAAAENPVDGSRPFAAAGLYSTVDDLHRYLQALETGELVSQKSLNALFDGHVPMGADNGYFTPVYEPPSYYGYGWSVSTYGGRRIVGHDGWIEGYGGDIRHFPDDGITIILLMNLSEPYAAFIGDQIVQAIFAQEGVSAP